MFCRRPEVDDCGALPRMLRCRWHVCWMLVLLWGALGGCTPDLSVRTDTETAEVASDDGPTGGDISSEDRVTYYGQVEPIIFGHCTTCHRAGEAGPFELLTYDDVKQHAGQIADVTGSGFMPPWLPDSSVVRYRNERLLTDEQKALIARWAEQGAAKGDPAEALPPPKFTAGWQLGEPDLVVRMEAPFEIPAGGPDIYRNFVIPIPLEKSHWVRGMELRPGNRQAVHHAFMLLDPTRTLRERDAEDETPGYPGMETYSAQSPSGEFISWQPGRVPRLAEPDMAWRLNPGTDLILQVHMQPTGRSESLQATVGFFFTDQPPSRFPLKIYLGTQDIDIPAGESDYWIRDQYTLPVDADVLSVSTHAHYLGKKMHGYAILPDGTRQWLVKIDDWDLNWQGDYVFPEPIHLPQGTTLYQEFSYDNSSDNVQNPFDPPRRVTYGLEATDEMGSLWIQLLPGSYDDFRKLSRDYTVKVMKESMDRQQKLLATDPNNVKARLELGKIALATGQFDAAQNLFDKAAELDPQSAMVQYYLGHLQLRRGNQQEGETFLKRALELDAQNFKARHDLGLAYLHQRRWPEAAFQFELALKINPYQPTALQNLARAAMQLGQPGKARDLLQQAMELEPHDQQLRQMLDAVERTLQR